ncbi:hypothetical protein GCM10009096_17660 [Parasphingorhabdus litoris]|uniref:Uncharacterized protein n=1 Tax=Parasphingorhabdus litoris TaxID=394733 RepID=A0ABN1AH59_9SPHN
MALNSPKTSGVRASEIGVAICPKYALPAIPAFTKIFCIAKIKIDNPKRMEKNDMNFKV